MSSSHAWEDYCAQHPETADIHGIERVALRQRVRHGDPVSSGRLWDPPRNTSDGFVCGWWRPYSRVRKLGRLAKRRAREAARRARRRGR